MKTIILARLESVQILRGVPAFRTLIYAHIFEYIDLKHPTLPFKDHWVVNDIK